MCLGDKNVNYSWKSKHLHKRKEGGSRIMNFSSTCDHSYASSKVVDNDSDDDEFEDIDYSSIFDGQGNWQQNHKRSIIHVMDSYHVSHEAYHELRLAGKGHFPPLYVITNEKSRMSAEIPYIKAPNCKHFLLC